MMFRFIIIGLFILTPIAMADARPISYPTGWTSMIMNNGDVNSLHLHYSPTFKTSVGYKFEYWRDKDFTLNAVQMNNLLKRWNKKESQANLYLKSGIGAAHQNGDTDVGGFSGIAADWEDRQFFISYENRYTKAGNFDDFYQQSGRVGVTPYIGDYGDLHTWLMLQVEHSPESQDNFTVTPLVRFFKDVHLVETGMNNHGEILFNWVMRY